MRVIGKALSEKIVEDVVFSQAPGENRGASSSGYFFEALEAGN